jgi:hypothetical protein
MVANKGAGVEGDGAGGDESRRALVEKGREEGGRGWSVY